MDGGTFFVQSRSFTVHWGELSLDASQKGMDKVHVDKHNLAYT